MQLSEENEIRASMEGIAVLAGETGTIRRLGGLTNRVYQIGDKVLRIPGKGTEEYINRLHEKVTAEEAARIGASPDVLFADASSGIMVTRFIAGGETMSPDLFRTRIGAAARAGEAFRNLHTSGGKFPFRFELFNMIDDYLGVLSNKDVELPEGYGDVVKEAETIRSALAKNPAPLAPCHCDPLCENFLDTGQRMWIVDWEYAGMNDPMWDLGDLSVEGGFSEAQECEMLRAYFKGEPSPADQGRMVIYKALCDLLWTLWGLIQHANKNPVDDFHAYAANRFARCRSLMGHSDFARHLRALD
jgi:thiamine kinase-like enzyme